MIDMRLLTFREKIYSDASGKSMVLTARLKVNSEEPGQPQERKEVIVKAKAYNDFAESAKVLEELTMSSNRHPNICDVYGYSIHIFPQESVSRILIIMERLKCDLEQDAKDRLATGRFYTERELLDMLWQLVDGLYFMQQRGRCHRDIKPQNLFLSMDGKYKISDFGSCKMSIATGSRELQGSPLYLSPILKIAFRSLLMTNQKEDVQDNMFKSDVFSLGVTFVFLCLLRTPTELMNIDEMERELTKLMHSMSTRYTWRLMKYIFQMMIIPEDQRPDFEQLRAEMDLDHDAFPKATGKRDIKEVLKGQLGRFQELGEEEKRKALTAAFGLREVVVFGEVGVLCLNCGQPGKGNILFCRRHWACAACENQNCRECCQWVCQSHNVPLQWYPKGWYCYHCNTFIYPS